MTYVLYVEKMLIQPDLILNTTNLKQDVRLTNCCPNKHSLAKEDNVDAGGLARDRLQIKELFVQHQLSPRLLVPSVFQVLTYVRILLIHALQHKISSHRMDLGSSSFNFGTV